MEPAWMQDIFGKNRVDDELPDAGAYEYWSIFIKNEILCVIDVIIVCIYLIVCFRQYKIFADNVV